jgi:hypothetical protein
MNIAEASWNGWRRLRLGSAGLIACGVLLGSVAAVADADWIREWPRTDFSSRTIRLDEIESGGPPKDGIPAIDRPRFIAPKRPDAGSIPSTAVYISHSPGSHSTPIPRSTVRVVR